MLPKKFDEKNSLTVLGKADLTELSTQINVLVWNIYKAKRAAWMENFKALRADRDLVLLQEAVVQAPSDSYFNEDYCEWVMARSHQHPTTGVITGVKTGSVAAAKVSKAYPSIPTEPVLNTHKLLLETHYKVCDCADTLMVLNMHAINFVSTKKFGQHLSQLSGALANHSGPVILAGDFNTWSSQRMKLFLDLAAGADLTEAAMERKRKLSHLNQHLDHLFYRGMVLRAVESHDDVSSSDHAPITATFDYEE